MGTIDTTIQYPQVTVQELGFESGVILCANTYEAFVTSNNAEIEYGIPAETIKIDMVWLH